MWPELVLSLVFHLFAFSTSLDWLAFVGQEALKVLAKVSAYRSEGLKWSRLAP